MTQGVIRVSTKRADKIHMVIFSQAHVADDLSLMYDENDELSAEFRN